MLRKTTIGRISTLALSLAVLSAPAALAVDEQNVSGGITLGGEPLAIHGYDPVAYHTDGVAMVGSAKHTAVHEGAAYRFVSQANRERFETSPGKYVPRYGGFCAFGVSVNKKFDGDPRVWEIVDGKLYFNLDPEIQSTWAEDIPGNVRKADHNWSRIRDKAVEAL